jgi:hypothetical protein
VPNVRVWIEEEYRGQNRENARRPTKKIEKREDRVTFIV